MNVRAILLLAALVVGAFGVLSATAVHAADESSVAVVVDVSPQAEEADDDSGIWVQSWTVVAAAGAAAVGLLAFMARAIMGWVKPPPPPEEEH